MAIFCSLLRYLCTGVSIRISSAWETDSLVCGKASAWSCPLIVFNSDWLKQQLLSQNLLPSQVHLETACVQRHRFWFHSWLGLLSGAASLQGSLGRSHRSNMRLGYPASHNTWLFRPILLLAAVVALLSMLRLKQDLGHWRVGFRGTCNASSLPK